MPPNANTPTRVRSRITGRRYASVADAADYLACEHKLIRKMIAGGLVTGHRLPGSRLIRVDLDELDAAIVASTRQAGGAA
mgnify:CR=1 FL=1